MFGNIKHTLYFFFIFESLTNFNHFIIPQGLVVLLDAEGPMWLNSVTNAVEVEVLVVD